MATVEVKNLVKNFGTTKAVKGISFTIDKGEIFGLIGPNGAGKTTALRVVSTLLQINSGEVRIMEHDVKKQSDEVRKLISYLPEDAGAYKTLTGRGKNTKSINCRRRNNSWSRKSILGGPLHQQLF